MTQKTDAFADAVLQRVAELAYAELRPAIAAYAAGRQRRETATPTATADNVVPLRRARAAS